MTPEPEPKELSKWEVYEQRKAQLSEDLSAEEYQEACRRIANELGI